MSLGGMLGRRDLLRIGGLGLAASALPRPLKAAPSATADSVIVIWMAGGVTQFESFDPKPDAPEEIRGTLGTIPTAIPGVRFTEVMPGMARVLDRLTLVRSFSHDDNDHFLSQAWALSGRKVGMDRITTEPNLGAVVSKLLGPRGGWPGYVAVPGAARPGPPPHNLFGGGWLGAQYAPFCTGGIPRELDFAAAFESRKGPEPTRFEEDLRPADLTFSPGLSDARLRDRFALRERLEDALRRGFDRAEADSDFRAAFGLLDAPHVRKAFDLDAEPDALRDRYGRTKIGRRCLLARRIVEAGARFVLVDYGYDPDYGNLWDNHAVPTQRQPHISEMAKRAYHLAGTDQACAALIQDLDSRGLLDRTLVVFLTEFGRTPRINRDGGRDHWGPSGSIFFAGGGTARGRVLGATDKHGAYPTTRGFTPADVAATLYAALAIDRDTMLHDRLNRPIPLLPQGDPIPGVLSL